MEILTSNKWKAMPVCDAEWKRLDWTVEDVGVVREAKSVASVDKPMNA